MVRFCCEGGGDRRSETVAEGPVPCHDDRQVAGVEVTAVRLQGTIHNFMMLNTLQGSLAARGAIALTDTARQAALKTRPMSYYG